MKQPSHLHSRAASYLVESLALIALLIAALAACRSSLVGDTIISMTATPSLQSTSGQPTRTPEPSLPYPIAGIPHCAGLQNLGYVLRFEWPDIANALEKLADYNWGYYQCAVSQVDLKSLIKTKMPQPPYLWQEIAWVEHGESTGALFYHPVYSSYIYLWMLTHPDKKNSHLVIAKGDPGMPQTWDCRLRPPSFLSRLACAECNRSVP